MAGFKVTTEGAITCKSRNPFKTDEMWTVSKTVPEMARKEAEDCGERRRKTAISSIK
jgi:hypothetical protein